METLKSINFGESIDLQINKSVQKVYFNSVFVGFMTSKIINLLQPVKEFFISIDLTKEQISDIHGYRVDDSENLGYSNICLSLDSCNEYSDLHSLCEIVYNLIIK